MGKYTKEAVEAQNVLRELDSKKPARGSENTLWDPILATVVLILFWSAVTIVATETKLLPLVVALGGCLGLGVFSIYWLCWRGHDLKLRRNHRLFSTQAGDRLSSLWHRYYQLARCRDQKLATQEQVDTVLNSLESEMKLLWVEAHAQAGLLVDWAELSHEALMQAEEAARYVAACDQARAEMPAQAASDVVQMCDRAS